MSEPIDPAQYDNIAARYNENLDSKPHNAYYERPAMLALLPDLTGKRVLDAGCGNGWYCEQFRKRGAKVTIVDASAEMLSMARQRNGDAASYIQTDLQQPLTMLESESFDFVFSSLTLHYLADWSVPLSEFYRLLKPDGRFQCSVHHPFADWQIFRIEDYFARKMIEDDWNLGAPLRFYRRSLQDIISPLLTAHFSLTNLVEPHPVESLKDIAPDTYHTLSTSPLFLLITATKPH